jgi:hypothetical protein
MFLNPVSEDEIKYIINNLKERWTSGIDGIVEKVVKRSTEYIIKPLTNTCNASFEAGVFPDRLKIAVVKPTHKKGSKEDIKNYRLISLLPAFSKIIGRAMYIRLKTFITYNNILVEAQNGFREGRSTESAIQTSLDKIFEALDTKIMTIGIFLDLSKAYDVINHKILLTKLEDYGFRVVVNKRPQSYVPGHRQCVEVKYKGNKDIIY